MTSTALSHPAAGLGPGIAAGTAAADLGGERRWFLALSLLHTVLAGGAFAVLGSVFGFPDVLRLPAADVLAAFNENPGAIRAAYYAFAWSSLLFLPLAVLLRRLLAGGGRDGTLLALSAALGLGAALTQVLGFIRWTIVIPFVAETYADPATTPATREALAVVYEFANRYLGMTVGEHLGWLFQGSWVLLLGVVLARRRDAGRWLGPLGVVIAALILVGSLEQFQIGFEGTLALLTAVGTTAFPFWQIVLAVVLLRNGAGRRGANA